MKKEKLTVKYKLDGLTTKDYNKEHEALDKGIEKVAGRLGFKRYASGYSFANRYRDVAFDK